ncbi:hypothetical protein HDK77DRAFT_298028 [Phyllosticta capitalensis]|uniref:uncharacterized protein n=1 Tax=Phyllosticta capitalensis TaxID=121624 RepID=UPI00312D39B0
MAVVRWLFLLFHLSLFLLAWKMPRTAQACLQWRSTGRVKRASERRRATVQGGGPPPTRRHDDRPIGKSSRGEDDGRIPNSAARLTP